MLQVGKLGVDNAKKSQYFHGISFAQRGMEHEKENW